MAFFVLCFTCIGCVSAALYTGFLTGLSLISGRSYTTSLSIYYSRFRARSHTGVMDYDEACFMHLTPGVVHNFPKAVGV